MKIDNAPKNTGPARVRQSKAGKAKTQATAGGNDTVSDNVDLTSESTLMQSLESSLADQSPTDPGKIEAIRQAIAEGRFKVDEEVVAEKLVQETTENLRRGAKKKR
jgi:negative regulator of flagellin synthesis FlgM